MTLVIDLMADEDELIAAVPRGTHSRDRAAYLRCVEPPSPFFQPPILPTLYNFVASIIFPPKLLVPSCGLYI